VERIPLSFFVGRETAFVSSGRRRASIERLATLPDRDSVPPNCRNRFAA
jgi:hypothetical protein